MASLAVSRPVGELFRGSVVVANIVPPPERFQSAAATGYGRDTFDQQAAKRPGLSNIDQAFHVPGIS